MNEGQAPMLTSRIDSSKFDENRIGNYTEMIKHSEIREVLKHAKNSEVGFERRKGVTLSA